MLGQESGGWLEGLKLRASSGRWKTVTAREEKQGGQL